jgi:alcohol dehydrogenase, propanol-preferring
MYSSIKRCNLKPASWLIISGWGGALGHLGIQFAKALGYHVVGIDARVSALQTAASLGACDVLIDAMRKESAKDLLPKINGGRGADAAIILPEVQTAFDFAVKLVGSQGTMCVVSFPNEGFRFSCADVVFRDVKIIGTRFSTRDNLSIFSEIDGFGDLKSIETGLRRFEGVLLRFKDR